MGIAELRRSVDSTSDEVRPVPLLEREDRRAQQQTRLRGVECEALFGLRPCLIRRSQRSFKNLGLSRPLNAKGLIRGRMNHRMPFAIWRQVVFRRTFSKESSGRWALRALGLIY